MAKSSAFALGAFLSVLAVCPRSGAADAQPISPLRTGIARTIDALKANEPTLPERFVIPAQEQLSSFLEQIIALQKDTSLVEYELRKVLEDLEQLRKHRQREGRHWQASYDYVHARLERRIAQLANYNYMLGQLRKNLAGDPRQAGGWQLIAAAGAIEDREVDRLARKAQTRLEVLAREHKGSAWEMLARRELLAPVKLQWQSVK